MRLAVARDEGLDEQLIGDVLAGTTDHFPPHQRAALALADAMMTQPSALDVTTVVALRQHFTNEQLVELSVDIMKWNVQKATVALGTDVWLQPGELTDLIFDQHGNWVR